MDSQGHEEADYLANKLSTVIAEARSKPSMADKIRIGLQVAQFIVVGVIGTGVAWYGEQIKAQNQLANDKVVSALKETETRATQARVVEEIVNLLFDTKDETKPKAAVLIIKQFIDPAFALQIAELVPSQGTRAAADQILQSEAARAIPVAVEASANAKSGWVYLGRYDGEWTTQLFDFPRDKGPDDLSREKSIIKVKPSVGSVTLRKEPMRADDPSSSHSIIGAVKPSDSVQIDRVEPRLGSSFMWAFVRFVAQ